MSIRLIRTDLHYLDMETRIPFKYGIATLHALPHLFLRVEVDVDGSPAVGIASDGLAPKWFTKDPATTLEHDIEEMIEVIQSAVGFAEELGQSESVFSFWMSVYEKQKTWGAARGLPPLLTSFGVSLVERALISAYCHASGHSFHENLLSGEFGFRLSAIHPDLDDAVLEKVIPAVPADRLAVRHTVGLGDPLTRADIVEDERTDDTLPHSLDDCIAEYGITKLKIKLSGDTERDTSRLLTIASLMDDAGIDYAYTLDGNEQFHSLDAFKAFWEKLTEIDALQSFLTRLIFVEQPIFRTHALSPETGHAMLAWADRPKMIIDESDGELLSAADALNKGYAGCSHKNCKGVFKGIANACLMSERGGILSAEDLCNVGPVALMQDLTVIASLNVTHVERNGHHYLKGLSMFPEAVQKDVLGHHSDMYGTREDYAALKIQDGMLAIRSLLDAPFALGFDLDTRQFTPVDEWKDSSFTYSR